MKTFVAYPLKDEEGQLGTISIESSRALLRLGRQARGVQHPGQSDHRGDPQRLPLSSNPSDQHHATSRRMAFPPEEDPGLEMASQRCVRGGTGDCRPRPHPLEHEDRGSGHRSAGEELSPSQPRSTVWWTPSTFREGDRMRFREALILATLVDRDLRIRMEEARSQLEIAGREVALQEARLDSVAALQARTRRDQRSEEYAIQSHELSKTHIHLPGRRRRPDTEARTPCRNVSRER